MQRTERADKLARAPVLPLPKWFLRCAVLYLLAGTAIGAYLLAARAWGLGPYPYRLITVHNHLISIGTFLFMIVGVSLWMFPRTPGQSAQEAQRDPFGWASFAFLNVGVLVRSIVEPWASRGEISGHLLGASAVALVLGIGCYAVAIWKRIRGPRA